MLEKGTKVFQFDKKQKISVLADGVFVIYLLKDGERESIIGPRDSNVRQINFILPNNSSIEVVCQDLVMYSVIAKELPEDREIPDPRPLEAAISTESPLSLRDEMKRFIRQEFSRQAEVQGEESIEDADDFDIEDDDMLYSPHEYKELQDDYLPEDNVSLLERQAPEDRAEPSGEGESPSEAHTEPVEQEASNG